MINEIYKDAEIRMEKCVDSFKKYINKIRSGRASPNLLSSIQIECYGKIVPLHQISNIIVEDYRTLVITVFDRALVSVIEKTIMISDLDLNPSSTDTVIRISLPPLTEERRNYFVKLMRAEAENGKISVRNIRRDANHKLKVLLKNKTISNDDDRRSQDRIQKLTNSWIKKLEIALEKKEAELMEI